MNARLTAPDRVVRLLAVIPYVAGRRGVPVDELAERFSYPRNELIRDLTGVVSFVGIAPFTPDTMIEVAIEDDRVSIEYAPWFELPLRLEASEILPILIAGKAMLATTDDDDREVGPLLSALTKLGAAYGMGDESPVDIVLSSGNEQTLSLLRRAVDQRHAVRIDYYSYGRDSRSQRVVEPHRVFGDVGQWYLGAYCRSAAGPRVFRIDRIHSAEILDEVFEAADAADHAVVNPLAAPDRAVLDLAPEARWVVDHYPHAGVVEREDGHCQVTLPVTALAWLERLLVRLGPAATMAPPPLSTRNDPTGAAARRILARYQSSPASPNDGIAQESPSK